MKRWSKHIILSAFLLVNFMVAAQDPAFSPYWMTPLFYNPSETGNFEEKMRATAIYQNQWLDAGDAFITTGGSVDMNFWKSSENSGFLALGISVIQDKAGTANIGYILGMASVSYHLKLNQKNRASAGIQLGYGQRSLSLDGLTWDSQFNGVGYDPNLPSNENFAQETRGFPDGAFGMQWQRTVDRNFTYGAGYALHHFMQGHSFLEDGTDRLYMRHTLHGKLLKTFSWAKMQFHGRVMNQGGSMLYEAGALGEFRMGNDSHYTNFRTSSAALGGVSFRWANSITPTVGYEYKRMLRITFSYSLNFGKLSNYTNGQGAMEVNLTYRGWLKSKRKKLR